jgi:hypothetical protein
MTNHSRTVTMQARINQRKLRNSKTGKRKAQIGGSENS